MTGYLKLANGETFSGTWYGEQKNVVGDLIFYTGMNRFQEIITDPTLKGKIVVFTQPQIRNNGIQKDRLESEQVQVSAVIVNDISQKSYQQHSTISFLQLLKKHQVPLLTNIDTRALMKRIRTLGEMEVAIKTKKKTTYFPIEEKPLKQQMCLEKTQISTGEKHLVVIDFGTKKSLLQSLSHFGHQITTIPFYTKLSEMKALKPDGIVFSGGPGNPYNYKEYFPIFKSVARNYPTIAFGLGHQVLSASFGAQVKKRAIGHRGFQEPVINKETQQVFLSNQNHEYEVNESSLKDSGFQVTYQHVNDQGIEGLKHIHYPISTFQFHPNRENDGINQLIYESFFNDVKANKGEVIYA